jgi:hypothetical protein
MVRDRGPDSQQVDQIQETPQRMENIMAHQYSQTEVENLAKLLGDAKWGSPRRLVVLAQPTTPTDENPVRKVELFDTFLTHSLLNCEDFNQMAIWLEGACWAQLGRGSI